jgi:hypothetical protein
MSDKRRAILPRMRCDDDVGAEIARLRAEVMEQSRLLGMSGEREAILRARIDANAIEYDRLLSRCAALEHVRQQAKALIDYEDAGPDDPAGKSWMHWEEKFEALRAALKTAPQ